ncbi:hypothetical protein SOVF_162110, partial [Spinacia oleracea]
QIKDTLKTCWASISELPKWNYDGSSTVQTPGQDSEVILYPQAIFRDPFRGGNNILVICDAYTPAKEPIPANKRHKAAEIFNNQFPSTDDLFPNYICKKSFSLKTTPFLLHIQGASFIEPQII